MTTIRGILIDPFSRSASEFYIDEAPVETFAKRLAARLAGGCEWVQTLRVTETEVLWLDEEGLLKDWDSTAFFKFSFKPSTFIAGRAVLFGIAQDGEADSTMLRPDTIEAFVDWVDAKDVRVAAPTFTTWSKDGEEKTEYIHGVEEWNYETQPTHTKK